MLNGRKIALKIHAIIAMMNKIVVSRPPLLPPVNADMNNAAMRIAKLATKLTKKEYRAIFGQNEEEIEKVVKKGELIETERRSILESKR